MGEEPQVVVTDTPLAERRELGVWSAARLRRVLLSPRCCLVFLLLGISFRASSYLTYRSLWLDETCLTHNILNKPFSALCGPLDYNQAAPPLFLMGVKSIVCLLGDSERALELLPFLGSLIGLAVFYRIARRHMHARGALLAIAMLAGSGPLFRWAGEVKQYSTDAMATVVLIALALVVRQRPSSPLRWLGFGLGGAVAVWFSHPAIFIAAGAGLTLGLHAWSRRRWRELVWPVLAGGAILASFGLLYVVSLRSSSRNEFLIAFWREYFPAVPPRSWADVRQMLLLYVNLFGDPVYFMPATLGAALGLLGCISLWKRDRPLLGILMAPAIFLSVAAGMKLYPLGDRLVTFFVPPLILVMAEGIEAAGTLLTRWYRNADLAACGIPALCILVAVPYFLNPPRFQDVKGVMRYVGEHARDGDAVYAYSCAVPTVRYYAPRFGLGTVFEGPGNRGSAEAQIASLEPLRGRRAWLVFVHVCGPDYELLLQRANQFGRRVELFEHNGAQAILYDCTPATRPARNVAD